MHLWIPLLLLFQATHHSPILTEMALNLFQHGHGAGPVDHVDRQSVLPEAPRPPDAMQVSLAVGSPRVEVNGQVKVDDHRHLLDVNTCIAEISSSDMGETSKTRRKQE